MNMINRKQLYANQNSSRLEENKHNFCSAYFIPVYITFIIVKNCGFVIGFVILSIYFRIKTTIFNVKT